MTPKQRNVRDNMMRAAKRAAELGGVPKPAPMLQYTANSTIERDLRNNKKKITLPRVSILEGIHDRQG